MFLGHYIVFIYYQNFRIYIQREYQYTFGKWSEQIAKASRGWPRSKSIFMTVNIMSKLMQLVDYIGQT